MLKQLGSDALGLLEVIAFYPQGVDGDNLGLSVSDASHTSDKFCVLYLTYRTSGFIAMLAPLSYHLHPCERIQVKCIALGDCMVTLRLRQTHVRVH